MIDSRQQLRQTGEGNDVWKKMVLMNGWYNRTAGGTTTILAPSLDFSP